MENNNEKNSLFSKETLDSMAMAKILGGEDVSNKKCPNNTNCYTNCVAQCLCSYTADNCDKVCGGIGPTV